MTKSELIDSLLLRVNGGKVTTDSRVQRPDVEVMLASAINFAILNQYSVNKAETGTNEFPEDFIATYPDVEVQEDSNRDLKYIDLPTGILSLPKNYGLQSVSPMKGNDLMIQTTFNDRHHNSYYSNSFAGSTLYWLEGERVYFQNLATDKVLVRLIQSINDLEDDQQLPVPGGLEINIFQILEKWFMGTVSMPADFTPNNANPQ